MPKKPRSKRSSAAKKGWVTRRANLRSKAAKKGWITRRANLRKKKKKVKRVLRTEYQINVRYEPSRGPEIQIQISAIGPSNQTREQVLDVVEQRMYADEEEDDNVTPKGWTLHIVFWEKFGKQSFGNDELAWTRLAAIYPKAKKEVYDKTKKRVL